MSQHLSSRLFCFRWIHRMSDLWWGHICLERWHINVFAMSGWYAWISSMDGSLINMEFDGSNFYHRHVDHDVLCGFQLFSMSSGLFFFSSLHYVSVVLWGHFCCKLKHPHCSQCPVSMVLVRMCFLIMYVLPWLMYSYFHTRLYDPFIGGIVLYGMQSRTVVFTCTDNVCGYHFGMIYLNRNSINK